MKRRRRDERQRRPHDERPHHKPTPSPAIVAAGDDDETSDAVSADEDASDDDDDDGWGLLHSPRPTWGATWGAHDMKSRGGFKSEGVGCTILRSDRERPRRAKSRGAAKSAPATGNDTPVSALLPHTTEDSIGTAGVSCSLA